MNLKIIIMRNYKTIPMESNIGRKDISEERSLCENCKSFTKGECLFLGKITNKDFYHCSFYKVKK